MFENIFNMVMDVKRKTKNNIKVRMNTFMFCYHKNIEFGLIGRLISSVIALKSCTLKKTCLKIFSTWLWM
jgi:hypothetical protein